MSCSISMLLPVTSLCRTRSPSGLASEPREELLETEERRLLQSEARGERLGDWEEEEEEEERAEGKIKMCSYIFSVF